VLSDRLILSNRKSVYLEKKGGAVKNVDGIPREVAGKLKGNFRGHKCGFWSRMTEGTKEVEGKLPTNFL